MQQKVSPMMAQWQMCKNQAKDALLLFRMGDFYEAFYDDAVIIAQELDLTLTKRQGIPMSGVPHHTCENYIDKLVAKGHRIAIAEQTEDPKQTKGLVKREVVRVVTPGTVINSSLLSDKSNNFFVAVTRVGTLFGLVCLDLSTAEFFASEFEDEQQLADELYRLHPSEVLTSNKFYNKHESMFNDLKLSFDFLLNTYDDWHFDHEIAYTVLSNHFHMQSLDGFGLKGMVAAINAAGALVNYLQDNLNQGLEHIQELRTYTTTQYMTLDRNTQRNLELTESLQDGSKKNTLLSILDHTHTPMGGRLIRHWIKQPLLDPKEITQRQDAIQVLFSRGNIHQLLSPIRDLERLMMRITSGYASPRDIVALRLSLEPLPALKEHLQFLKGESALIDRLEENVETLDEMQILIANALADDPPARLSDGNVIRPGYNADLDELREICQDSKAWLARYQNELRETLGIKTLRVGFTKVFGYYIEVSKGQAEKMPDMFTRRQTLVNAQRFISPELKQYESKVLTAQDRISAIESELFQEIRREVMKYASQVFRIAQSIAQIDSLQSLAEAAKKYDYCRPTVDESKILHITEGRHPVIEGANIGEKFVPNDTLLDDCENRTFIITGPNMAGKSTYIRQVALIAIMAQIGSYVPAKSAHIGVIDKVFTRIGASDDLSRGQSTFMVEMTETANILNNATNRSLVILDEIGRGTSTYDGISIAWSVAEHLLTTEGKMAKTLFATHYWELTKMEEKIPGAVNYNVAVHESEDHIVFLRKIVRGGTDKSYGIHVGRLAGLPPAVLTRAKEILIHLEENANQKSVFEPPKLKQRASRKRKTKPENDKQMTFFDLQMQNTENKQNV